MIRVSREPPKCRGCGRTLEWLPWKNGKPQAPVVPATKKPCPCWKTRGKGGDGYMAKTGRLFDKKNKYKQCPYCDGWFHIYDGNERHEEVYHKDKKIHKGKIIAGDGCFADEVLYHGTGEHWYLKHPDENGDFLSVEGIENVREFAKKHGIEVIRSEYLLD